MVENVIKDYEPINKEKVKGQIVEIRGIRVMLDSDLANYFGVTTGNLNKAMKRNIKRFPEHFCFQLKGEECSKFQIGILNGGRGTNIKYLPYVYSEQGIAMLTAALHTDRAIEASIKIIEAFVEMNHIIRNNQSLLPYDELKSLEIEHHRLSAKVQKMGENMITREDLSMLISFFEEETKAKEILILNGEPFKADVAYQKIYSKAKKNIIIIDDYLGIKTLQHLSHSEKGISITIISDNRGNMPLRLSEYKDYLIEYPGRNVKFLKSENKSHDRYIVLDYNNSTMRIYHCGASSKDAGNKITTITEIKQKNVFIEVIKELLNNPKLELK